jgi:hypothetical protein
MDITFEEQVREKLGLTEDDECFVWFINEDLQPIEYDDGLRMVYCQNKIRFWSEIFP